MSVYCYSAQCLYCGGHPKSAGFCKKPTTMLDANGMCTELWHNGQPRQRLQEYVEYRAQSYEDTYPISAQTENTEVSEDVEIEQTAEKDEKEGN